jgi:predicted enzyme related to lactoylglutathione lyase
VFDWNFYGDNQPAEYSKDDIVLFDHGTEGNISGGIRKVEGPIAKDGQRVSVYYIVEDIERSAALILSAGGKMVGIVEKEGENGLYRHFEDTEGCIGVIFQYVGPLLT